MRYHYTLPFSINTYSCDHPLYSTCTLFQDGDIGLAVVQLRYSKTTKMAFYTAIDSDISVAIGLNEGMPDYIKEHGAEKDEKGLYPTKEVRKVMWALKIKPIPKNTWEKGLA